MRTSPVTSAASMLRGLGLGSAITRQTMLRGGDTDAGGGGPWLDNFIGSSGARVSDHIADSGHSYTSKEDDTRVLELDGAGGAWLDALSANRAIVLANAVSYQIGDEFSMDLSNMTNLGGGAASTTEMGFWFNFTGTSASRTGIAIIVRRFGNNWTVRILRVISNTENAVGTPQTLASSAALPADTMKVVIVGTNIVDVYWGGVKKIAAHSIAGGGITIDNSAGIGAITESGRDRVKLGNVTLVQP